MPEINFLSDEKKSEFTLTRVDGFWFMDVPTHYAKQAKPVIQSKEYILLTDMLSQLFDTIYTSTMFDKINTEIETVINQLRRLNNSLRYTLFDRKNFQPIIDEANSCAITRILSKTV